MSATHHNVWNQVAERCHHFPESGPPWKQASPWAVLRTPVGLSDLGSEEKEVYGHRSLPRRSALESSERCSRGSVFLSSQAAAPHTALQAPPRPRALFTPLLTRICTSWWLADQLAPALRLEARQGAPRTLRLAFTLYGADFLDRGIFMTLT